ncbi:MAG: hypothetical protein ACRDNA_02480, partial [Gaiellaceae bacterium]
MSDEPTTKAKGVDAETGFGTGLRGKLEKRREPDEAADGAAPEEVAAASNGAGSVEADALRAELAASLDRERELRSELSAAFEARGESAALDSDYAARTAELDVRAARLASSEQELELREARLTEQLAQLREERERLSELETRLAATEGLTDERSQHVEAKLHELKQGDREREKLAADLAKQTQAVASQ